MSVDPLAREVPANKRKATLEQLLALVEAKRKGPKPAPQRPVTKAPSLSVVPDRRARLEALLERVRRAPRRTHR